MLATAGYSTGKIYGHYLCKCSLKATAIIEIVLFIYLNKLLQLLTVSFSDTSFWSRLARVAHIGQYNIITRGYFYFRTKQK